MSHPLSNMMESSIEKIRTMVDANTVVGDAITTPDGVTIIPISKISIGLGGGGSDYVTKHTSANGQNPYGGGVGAGITITPVSFLIIKNESVRVLPIPEPASGTVDRIVDMLPEIADKVAALLKKEKPKAETAEDSSAL